VIATGSSRRSCVGSKGFPLPAPAPPMPPRTLRLVEAVGSATNWCRRRGAGGWGRGWGEAKEEKVRRRRREVRSARRGGGIGGG
jgi:hypothetical protein